MYSIYDYSTKYKSYWKNVGYYLNFCRRHTITSCSSINIYHIYIAKFIQNINFNVVNQPNIFTIGQNFMYLNFLQSVKIYQS